VERHRGKCRIRLPSICRPKNGRVTGTPPLSRKSGKSNVKASICTAMNLCIECFFTVSSRFIPGSRVHRCNVLGYQVLTTSTLLFTSWPGPRFQIKQKSVGASVLQPLPLCLATFAAGTPGFIITSFMDTKRVPYKVAYQALESTGLPPRKCRASRAVSAKKATAAAITAALARSAVCTLLKSASSPSNAGPNISPASAAPN